MNEIIIDKDQIECHPAVSGLIKLNLNKPIPDEIETLADKKKSNVLRLRWNKGDIKSMIAKGAPFKKLQLEIEIYTYILPKFPFSNLCAYGLIENAENDFSWMFLEDSPFESFNPESINHRMAGIQWLGTLHGYQLDKDLISKLPKKDTPYFTKIKKKTEFNITTSLDQRSFIKNHRELLKSILHVLDRIMERWELIEATIAKMPFSLIHGDYIEENLTVNMKNLELMAYDWEMAAWGLPIFDLGSPLVYEASKEELEAYLLALNNRKIRNPIDLKYYLHLGRILKLLVYIYWESLYLDLDWIEGSMKRFEQYKSILRDIFNKLQWSFTD